MNRIHKVSSITRTAHKLLHSCILFSQSLRDPNPAPNNSSHELSFGGYSLHLTSPWYFVLFRRVGAIVFTPRASYSRVCDFK